MKELDYVIIGSGLFGSVCARKLTDWGSNCLVIDKRNHSGGNCYTENVAGIKVHKYGPHIFHTSNKVVWDYVNKYTEFNNFINRPKVFYNGKIYSFPINLFTLYQLYDVKTPEEAHKKLESVRVKNDFPQNLEEWALDKIGRDLYEIFIKGYTLKQWNRNPKDLPCSIIKRIPVRLTFNDNYYEDRYQGVSIGGYTRLFKKLLEGIEVKLESDYLDDREYYNKIGKKIIYTGNIDGFYNYQYGNLEYRTLRFETTTMDIPDYQGNAVINYTNSNIPYTRCVEHKYFDFTDSKNTVITREYPEEWDLWKEPLYPINDAKNGEIYYKYKLLAEKEKNVIFGGRLGTYSYLDMDQTINLALLAVKKETS
jgi:UDP-galactopyranose mutase